MVYVADPIDTGIESAFLATPLAVSGVSPLSQISRSVAEMRVLFVSRTHPPLLGGIEKQNFEICRALREKINVVAVVNRRGKWFLPIFGWHALLIMIAKREQYDLVLLGDGVLTILAWLYKPFSKKPVVTILHGLDVTYNSVVYRELWIKLFFRAPDYFICVGNETIARAKQRGVAAEKLGHIPNGVEARKTVCLPGRDAMEGLLGFKPNGPVLLTVGRLVKRKGVYWFIREVMPKLNTSICYIIAGGGPEEAVIKKHIASSDSCGRIHYLGRVSEDDKRILMSGADLFIQPNIPVDNDIEGFGLVVLEAAMFSTFVVASRIEGLMDAITDGINGKLVEAGDAEAFRDTIEHLLNDPAQLRQRADEARQFVSLRYSWDGIADRYCHLFEALLSSKAH